jgi:hypothetical protein
MKLMKLLDIFGDEPVFETGLLLVSDVNPNNVHRQLTQWAQADKIHYLPSLIQKDDDIWIIRQ